MEYSNLEKKEYDQAHVEKERSILYMNYVLKLMNREGDLVRNLLYRSENMQKATV